VTKRRVEGGKGNRTSVITKRSTDAYVHYYSHWCQKSSKKLILAMDIYPDQLDHCDWKAKTKPQDAIQEEDLENIILTLIP
jgi:hypothetical protein